MSCRRRFRAGRSIVPRNPAVIVVACHQLPAKTYLRSDEGCTSFALCVERIEFLLQALFSRLASVDGTVEARGHRHSPKNLGPDQWAPVMRRATADNDPYVFPSSTKPSSTTSTMCIRPFHSRIRREPAL